MGTEHGTKHEQRGRQMMAFLAPAVVLAGFACAGAGSSATSGAHTAPSRPATDNRGATVYFKPLRLEALRAIARGLLTKTIH